MSVYAGVGGHYWEKDAIVSRGMYMLDESHNIVFGEPVREHGTGTFAIPQNKKYCRSFQGIPAGSEAALGVSIEWRRAVQAWDDEDMALRGRQEFKRDISLVKHGGCTVKNMGTGMIPDGARVIPCHGGCQVMTVSGQHSLGIAKQDIEPLQYGLIQIQPDEEKGL